MFLIFMDPCGGLGRTTKVAKVISVGGSLVIQRIFRFL